MKNFLYELLGSVLIMLDGVLVMGMVGLEGWPRWTSLLFGCIFYVVGMNLIRTSVRNENHKSD